MPAVPAGVATGCCSSYPSPQATHRTLSSSVRATGVVPQELFTPTAGAASGSTHAAGAAPGGPFVGCGPGKFPSAAGASCAASPRPVSPRAVRPLGLSVVASAPPTVSAPRASPHQAFTLTPPPRQSVAAYCPPGPSRTATYAAPAACSSARVQLPSHPRQFSMQAPRLRASLGASVSPPRQRPPMDQVQPCLTARERRGPACSLGGDAEGASVATAAAPTSKDLSLARQFPVRRPSEAKHGPSPSPKVQAGRGPSPAKVKTGRSPSPAAAVARAPTPLRALRSATSSGKPEEPLPEEAPVAGWVAAAASGAGKPEEPLPEEARGPLPPPVLEALDGSVKAAVRHLRRDLSVLSADFKDLCSTEWKKAMEEQWAAAWSQLENTMRNYDAPGAAPRLADPGASDPLDLEHEGDPLRGSIGRDLTFAEAPPRKAPKAAPGPISGAPMTTPERRSGAVPTIFEDCADGAGAVSWSVFSSPERRSPHQALFDLEALSSSRKATPDTSKKGELMQRLDELLTNLDTPGGPVATANPACSAAGEAKPTTPAFFDTVQRAFFAPLPVPDGEDRQDPLPKVPTMT